MKDKISIKRKKYAAALLAATAATVATSFSPSTPWVMASGGASDTDPFLPPDFGTPPVYNDVDPKAYYYNVQGSDNVTVEKNTFKTEDFDGNEVTFNNFIVKANDTLVEDSDDIVVDQGNSEHAEKGNENGVTRKYKLTLSKELKDKIDKAAAGGGGGGAAPSKLEAGTNTTVEGDGTEDNKYKVNINPELTGITSITGNNGLTFTGAGTAVTINATGVNVGGAKVTNLADAALTNSSTDAVTGKQLHETNEKVKAKLDKTAERHIKPQAYTVENGTVTLKYEDANGKETTETATISGLNPVKSVTSGDTNTLTVANNNGDITVTPVVAADVTKADDANKLATAGAVNTAINNATSPLADKSLSNITDDGKKVITGLSTEVVQGDGVTVTPNTDTTTGKKTYTISAVKPNFANGTNTTVDGDGTKDKPYKYNVNPALTGITSITGDTGLTFTGAGTAVTINGNGVNVGGAKVTNLADAVLTNSSTDAVTGKQLHATNEKVEGKVDKTAERHIKAQAYTVENGTVTLHYVDAEGKDKSETATISGLNPVKSVTSGDANTLTVANNNGAITVTPVVAADVTATGDANKLATAGVVNTAINNATSPLANKNLSNITDDGKKVITGLSTEVVQGDGVTVTPNTDATTGKKTYTISALKPKFAAGTNTTLEGDGTVGNPYKYNVNSALTGITSITGDTGLTFTGAGTAVTINATGVNVGGKKITNLADAALTGSSTDAVTGKQLHETNEKVEGKLDKTAERHIKPEAYTVNDGTVTLKYVDANGKVTDETATISGLNPVKSVASGDTNTLTVANNNGDITVTPVVAADVTKADDANKLTTASVVNTAINNATNPLANKALSNITDDGKKVITGLSTEVLQGDGVTVTPAVDGTTGKKTYTISAAKLNFANGTNTTVEGDGTVGNPYKYNVNPALTGITSITNATTADGDGTKLTVDGDKLSVVNKKGADTTTVTIGKDGIDAGGKSITNVADPTGDKDAANKEYVDSKVWGLKIQNGDNAAEDVTAKDKAITLKASADASDDATKPKKGLLITKDGEGNITVGLDKATRTALDNAVNGSQLLNERLTSPVIFVDKDGKQVFKTVDGKFTTKDGAEITNADDLDKVHTKVNADKAMTLDNVASALGEPAQDADYLAKLKEAKEGNTVNNSAVNVTDLHNTANALVTKGLDFQGNLGDKIHKDLGAKLEIVGEGTVVADATTAANNIRTKNVGGKLEIGLVQDLTGITSITGGAANNDTKIELGKTGLKVTNTVTPDAGGAPETKTITIGKDGINADGTKITNVATPTDKADAANKEYVDAQKWGLKVQNGADAATDVTPANKVVTFKTGTGTVAPTNLPAGQDSPTKDTDNVAPKKGIVLETDNQGNVTIGLEKADRTTLDNAANIGNTASDGRDGQAGAGKDGVAVAGSAGEQGPTGKDGLNGKDLTSKVNALRNGEAGTVVYTNAAGDRVVKANDGKYYKADEVKPDGNVKTETENGGKAPVAVTPEARLVSPDGTTTGATNKLSNIANGTISESSKDAVNGSQLFNERVTSPVIFVDKDGNQVFKTTDGKFVDKNGAEVPADKIHTKLNAGAPMTLDNVASAVENATVPNAADPNNVTFKEKLAAAAGDVATKHSAVNVEDLHKATADTSDALVTKGLNFQGNLGDAIHKDLGAKLDIVGEGTVAADATTAADNIRTKNVDGKLEIGIVKDLKNITSITNATTADGDGTKLTIDGDKLSVVNKKGTDKTTVTIGKDGINAGGTKITNVAEGAISKDSTDVVIGKQLAATNEKVSNLEETKLNKTDDVHVKAGKYTVDDTKGTVELPLVKGDADTATGKNVTISGIVTHASLSNTMDAYELNIAGDKDSKATTTLKKGLAVRGAENFTPDAATQEKGINIQATATEDGVNIKLSDTLTKMKGITFTPAENSKEAVSLTSNGLDNGGHTITNVAAGRNDTDVVNVAQLKGIVNVVGDVNNRVNRSSAQSAALARLQTLQYDPLEPTQISAGVGYYKGSTALALGVGHYKNESTLFHVGASVNGHGDEVMANASVTWKFGSRATESAVKDTYRQGPISASYTLQDKVSALEAQNQIQSEKINAQNQVIEDLKAQLAEVLQYIKK